MSRDKATEYYFELYNMLLIETIIAYKKRNRSSRQRWEVISAEDLKQCWNQVAIYGFIRRPSTWERIRTIIIENVIKLQINTELMGHDTHYPDELKEWNLSGPRMSCDFFREGNAGLRISDYGLKPANEYLLGIFTAIDDKQEIMYADMILNIVHQRSDWARWFVEGGSKTLSELFLQQQPFQLTRFI